MDLQSLTTIIESLIEPGEELASMDAEPREKLLHHCLKQFSTFQFLQSTENVNTELLSPSLRSRVKVGGSPGSIADWPMDASGKPMSSFVEVDLHFFDDPLKLSLYFSASRGDYPEKSQSWYFIRPGIREEVSGRDSKEIDEGESLFAVPVLDVMRMEELMLEKGTKSDASDKVDEVVIELCQLFKRFNSLIFPDSSQLNAFYSQLTQARRKAAFFANGISYSDARVKDSHYSHLLDDSLAWLVFFQIGENSILKEVDIRDILFTIRYDDLRRRDLVKGRPILI